MTVLIAGAGIAGLSLGLSLHQIDVPFHIYESVYEIKPLGVGINLQPSAVRELFEMGLETDLEQIGIRTQDYGFYTRTGQDIWTEPRGIAAGYHWPQYSVHRGALQMLLYHALVDRAGADCITTGAAGVGFSQRSDQVVLHHSIGHTSGSILIGADGIHSALRAQFFPTEGPPIWNGAVLWRGTTWAKPFLSGASMIMAGHDKQRVVAYPISKPDQDGLALVNWIAELRFDPQNSWTQEDWNRAANPDDFAPKFADWRFDWLDVPALINKADVVYEYPMVDRDPVDHWYDGRVALIGDAAHATYPVGSNGASQAIIDARILAAALRDHGLTEKALRHYDATLRPDVNKVILANRTGGGPDGIMQLTEDRCNGDFSRLNSALPMDERAAHAARYKMMAGLDIDALNVRPSILP